MLHTLAHKYSQTIYQMIKRFTVTPAIWVVDTAGKKQQVASFVDPLAINTMKKEFMITKEDLSKEGLDHLLNAKLLKARGNRKFFF